MIKEITTALQEGVDEGHYSGAVWLVYKEKSGTAKGAVGFSSIIPEKEPMREDTIFDLASLTKPLITCPLIVKALSAGYIDFDAPLVDQNVLPFANRIGEVSVSQLLTHTSGIRSWYPCYAIKKKMLRGTAIVGPDGRILYEKVPKMIDQYVVNISAMPLDAAPGEKIIYTCLGYIILAYILQVKKRVKFKEEAARLIINPLELKRTFFDVPENLIKETAAGEDGNQSEKKKVAALNLSFDGWRSGIIRGTVNDCNAYYADSTTGNAGLFADIEDTLKMAKQHFTGSKLFPEDELRLMHENLTQHTGDARSLGWRLSISENNPAKSILSDHAIGHTGYTGTALWIDPYKKEVYILFLNRLHPGKTEFQIDDLRRKFLKLATEI